MFIKQLALRGIFSLSLCLLALGCGNDESPAAPAGPVIGTEWRLAESGSDVGVNALAVHDTLVVAVGDGGAVRTSTDGRTWVVQRQLGPGAGYLDVAWCRNQFVAAGYNGDVIVSANGIDWIRNATGEAGVTIFGVAASDSLTVAVGSAGAVFVSDDNDIWSYSTVPGGTDLYDVLCDRDDSLWLACGTGGVLLRSSDAASWLPQTTVLPSTLDFYCLAKGSDRYFAIGTETSLQSGSRALVYSSADGDIWDYEATLDAWQINDVMWTGTYLLAVGTTNSASVTDPDGVIFYSQNGSDWLKSTSAGPFNLDGVSTLGSEIIVGGSLGYLLSGIHPDSLEIRSSGATLTGCIWDGTRFVAVSDRGTTLWSDDGATWHEHPARAAVYLERLAWSCERLVAPGGPGIAGELYSSDEGSAWNRSWNWQGKFLRDLAWGRDRFVAVGQYGTALVSTSGDSWTEHYVGDSVILEAVCFDGNRFVAGTYDDGVYFSEDGIAWVKSSPDPIANVPTIERLVYAAGKYVAVASVPGQGGIIEGYAWTSSDGDNWNPHLIGPVERLLDVGWTGSHFVACGAGGQLFVSSAGVQWSELESGTDEVLIDIAASPSRAVIVGSNRTVLISP